MIYIMLFELGSKQYAKIGVTANISNRIKQIQPGVPGTVILADSFYCESREDAFLREQSLHHIFSPARIENSEWFEVDDQTIKMISDIFNYWGMDENIKSNPDDYYLRDWIRKENCYQRLFNA